MSEKIRLASIGLGRWAKVLGRSVLRSDEIELVNCFTRSAEKRSAFQAEFGVARSAATLEELLADDEVEGVIITTPNDTHRDIITACLEAGKGVYTEKPISTTLEDAAAITEAVTRTGGVFAVGHSARRLSGSRVMKEWIESGRTGGVSMLEANFSNERGLELTPDTWRWYADKAPGGPFSQLGVHHADNLQYLAGPVKAVTAHTRKVFTKAEVPDTVMAILEFESGALGYLGAGWASPGIYTINVQGTKANLRYDLDFTHWDESHEADEYSSLVSQEFGQIERSPVELPPTDMFREQLEEFGHAIRGEATIEVGAEEAVRALAVVHAGLRSAERDGAKVEIAEVVDAAGAGAAIA
ncbi:MAG: Gfo/Idh/MocA family oxidoreductase [Actinobacteria bacterium]|jgi:predicted dehydrogenase|nr:Gfo/Idh/MocA family oxidoreductase [Actinomycetota bacterium]